MNTLCRNSYLIKERKDILQNSNTFDIYDSATEEPLFECIPDNKLMPNAIKIVAHDGSESFSIVKENTFLEKVISLYDQNDQVMVQFKKKGFSLGTEYKMNNASNAVIGMLKGEWDNRSFALNLHGSLFAQIANEFTGMRKALKNTARDYSLHLNGVESPNVVEVMYAIAAVFCVDMTLKAY